MDSLKVSLDQHSGALKFEPSQAELRRRDQAKDLVARVAALEALVEYLVSRLPASEQEHARQLQQKHRRRGKR